MDWIEVIVEVPESTKDAVSNRMFELGAEGVTDSDGRAVTGCFAASKRDEAVAGMTQFLESLRQLHPKEKFGAVKVEVVASRDWAEEYKKFYEPQPFSNRFYLQPAWSTSETPKGKIAIFMEPGQAFGTGLHPSTQLCSRLLEQVVDGSLSVDKLRLIDLGTGTGILAIVAHRLGVKKITAIDNDPIAVDVARDNLKRNQCDGIDLSCSDFRKIREPFDIFVSNILLEAHREFAADYRRLLKPNGSLLISGLLGYQRAEIDEVFAKVGLVPGASAMMQEWAAATYVVAP